jgi:hypothetical protein
MARRRTGSGSPGKLLVLQSLYNLADEQVAILV